MKHLKRAAALVMALALTASLAACGMSKGSRTDGIYYDATGVSPDAVLLQVDGIDVTAERYFYWLYNAASNAAMYCGADGFGQEADEGLTYAQSCLDFTLETAREYCLVEKWAKEYGLAVSEETAADIESEISAYEEQYGDFGFDYMGITRETMEYFYTAFEYYDMLQLSTTEEGGALAPTEEELDAYVKEAGLMKADHILLATQDLYTGEELDEETRQAQYAKAQELLAQLQAAEDPETLFAELADEYSEDPGRSYYPDGYVFGPGEMVPEFEEAAAALEEGEISGIVESDSGYHILLRKALSKEELVADGSYFSYLLEKEAGEMEIKFSSLYEETVAALDVGQFYQDVYAARNTLYEAYEAEQDAAAGGEEQDGSGDGSSGGDGDGEAVG
ncbi:MAG: peptidylprolyl isomerase [Oscillospiraceae bacterium]